MIKMSPNLTSALGAHHESAPFHGIGFYPLESRTSNVRKTARGDGSWLCRGTPAVLGLSVRNSMLKKSSLLPLKDTDPRVSDRRAFIQQEWVLCLKKGPSERGSCDGMGGDTLHPAPAP